MDYGDPFGGITQNAGLPSDGMTPGLLGDYTDSTTVTGSPDPLLSSSPYPVFPPYSTLPSGGQSGVDGGFDWRSLLMGKPGQTASLPGSANGGKGSTGLLGALLPLLMHLLGGGGASNLGAADAQQRAQLAAMNQLLMEKAQRQAPVHQAAMNMALRMAPNGGSSPQMEQAVQDAQTPRPALQTDPQVLDAIHRLVSGVPR